MTLPYERTRAVLNTRIFLQDLMDPRLTPKVPLAVRRSAARLLKHYPTAFDLARVAPHDPAVFDETTARGYYADHKHRATTE